MPQQGLLISRSRGFITHVLFSSPTGPQTQWGFCWAEVRQFHPCSLNPVGRIFQSSTHRTMVKSSVDYHSGLLAACPVRLCLSSISSLSTLQPYLNYSLLSPLCPQGENEWTVPRLSTLTHAILHGAGAAVPPQSAYAGFRSQHSFLQRRFLYCSPFVCFLELICT